MLGDWRAGARVADMHIGATSREWQNSTDGHTRPGSRNPVISFNDKTLVNQENCSSIRCNSLMALISDPLSEIPFPTYRTSVILPPPLYHAGKPIAITTNDHPLVPEPHHPDLCNEFTIRPCTNPAATSVQIPLRTVARTLNVIYGPWKDADRSPRQQSRTLIWSG